MLVPKAGPWVGRAASGGADARQEATLIVVEEQGHKDRWVLLTPLPPETVEHSRYGLRRWIELGFRALNSMGW